MEQDKSIFSVSEINDLFKIGRGGIVNDKIVPGHIDLEKLGTSLPRLKELIAKLSSDNQQALYEFLHDGCGRRMYK